MKKYFYLFVILTLIATSLPNCKKNNTNSTTKMQANVNNSLTICDAQIYVRRDCCNIYGIAGYQKGGNGLF